ncbi:hypothetical protein BDR07DRAFT_1400600 [Suillus spraguei]|nr:hypothetical protein BDR07DRAFT_1400600 [Suillus spraguei]
MPCTYKTRTAFNLTLCNLPLRQAYAGLGVNACSYVGINSGIGTSACSYSGISGDDAGKIRATQSFIPGGDMDGAGDTNVSGIIS